MSNIIEKAFDASKKIVRSIFKGAPNLLTATDLNRQFEALKSQIDSVEENQRVISDLSVDMYVDYTRVSSDGAFINKINVTKVIAKGCSFSPKVSSETLSNKLAASMRGKTWYICLVAKKKVVTYEDDFSHEIAGAKFEDGTSLPAANQEVYYDEEIIVTSEKNPDNCVLVLGKFEVPNAGEKHETIQKIKVAKYWTSSPFEYDFQKIEGVSQSKFDTLDLAISSLIEGFSSLGKRIYTGKCKCKGVECGSWVVITIGTSFQCYVSITENLKSLLYYPTIILEGFRDWKFITPIVPVRSIVNVSLTNDSATKVLKTKDFGDAYFRARSVVTFEEGSMPTSRVVSDNNTINGFVYTGSESLDAWKAPQSIENAFGSFIKLSFMAMIWNPDNIFGE